MNCEKVEFVENFSFYLKNNGIQKFLHYIEKIKKADIKR